MPKRRKRAADDGLEQAIRAAGSIGDLERLAGIPQDQEARYQFWKAYSHLKSEECLDTGVAELKRRIRAKGAST